MVYRAPPPEFGGNPLASDEHNIPGGGAAVEFGGIPSSQTGLGLNTTGSPLGMRGVPNMPNMEQAMQATRQIANAPPMEPRPSSDTQPQIFYSPSTGNIVVNGFTFNQRNATQALASEQWANQPARQFSLPDTASDWRAMSQPEYASYLDTIKNPGVGRRIGEAWESGWRGAGDVAIGGGLAIAEATGNHWHWGDVARQNIAREYEENAPFILGLRDVKNPGDALIYAAQAVVQSAPWIVETIASMAAGAVVGGAVSGGAGAPAGAIEGFIAKEGIRRATMLALRGTIRRGAEAYTEALAANGGRALTREQFLAHVAPAGEEAVADATRFYNFGERAFHLSRGAPLAAGGEPLAGVGAQVGSAFSNYAMGVGDIRNSIADAGGDTTTANAVANIWGLAIPYAAIESLGDTILTNPLTHLFPELHGGPNRLVNAARHAGLVGAGEGIEEGAQYGIDQQAIASTTNTPISIDPYDLLSNVVAGALGGAGIGGVFGAMEHPTQPTSVVTPAAGMAGPTAPTGPTGPLLLPGPTTPPVLYGAPDGTVTGNTPSTPFTGAAYTPAGPLDQVPSLAGNPSVASSRQTVYPPAPPHPYPAAPEAPVNWDAAVGGIDLSTSTPAAETFNTPAPTTQGPIMGLRGRTQEPAATPTLREPSYEDLQQVIHMDDLTSDQKTTASIWVRSTPEERAQLEPYRQTHPELFEGVDRLEQLARDNPVATRGQSAAANVPTNDQVLARGAGGRAGPVVGDQGATNTATLSRVYRDVNSASDVDLVKAEEIIKTRMSEPTFVKESPQVHQMHTQLLTAIQQELASRSQEDLSPPPGTIEATKASLTPGNRAGMRRSAKKQLAKRNKFHRGDDGNEVMPSTTEERTTNAQRETVNRITKELDSVEKVQATQGQLLKAKEFAKQVEKNPEKYGVGVAVTKDDGKRFTREDAVAGQTYTVNEGTEWAEDLVAQPDSYLLQKPDGALHSVITKTDFAAAYEKKADGTYGTKVGREVKFMAPKTSTAVHSKESTIKVGPEEIHKHAVQDATGMWYAVNEDVFQKKYQVLRNRVGEAGQRIEEAKNAVVEGKWNEDKPLYRGIDLEHINKPHRISVGGRLGKGVYFSFSKDHATKWGNAVKAWVYRGQLATVEQYDALVKEHGKDEATSVLRSQRFTGIYNDKNTDGDVIKEVVIFDPKNIKEYPYAVPEQSTKSVPVRKQSGSSERVREAHSQREEAARPRQAEKETQALHEGSEVSQTKVQEAYDAALARAREAGKEDPVKSARQSAAAIKGKLFDKDGNRTKAKTIIPWAKNLTADEFVALIQKFDSELGTNTGFKKAAKERRAEATAEKTSKKAEASARSFGAELSKWRKDHGDSKIAEFVLGDMRGTLAWLESQDAKEKAGLRKLVEQVLRNNPAGSSTQQARTKGSVAGDQKANATKVIALAKDMVNKTTNKLPNDYAARIAKEMERSDHYVKALLVSARNGEFGKDLQAEAKTIPYASNADKIQQVADDKPITFFGVMTVDMSPGKVRMLFGLDEKQAKRLRDLEEKMLTDVLDTDGLAEMNKLREIADMLPITKEQWASATYDVDRNQHTTGNDKRGGALTFRDTKDAVKRVQSLITKDMRFNTVHVFEGINDLFDRAKDEYMIAPNGAKVSIARWILGEVAQLKLENPSLRERSDVDIAQAFAEQFLGFRAAVINPFGALIVITNRIDTKEELMGVLEHEYIVHKGLAAIFPDRTERALFLQRVGQIPGVEQKRLALVAAHPYYAQQGYLFQVEEVLAYHSMEGPLALKTLLSAKEGINQATRLTLWEDFKKLVNDWVQRVFNGFRRSEDEALSAVIAALREHAVLGNKTGVELNRVLDNVGARDVDPAVKAMFEYAHNSDEPQYAAAAGTPEATHELLFGTNTEPGRPHSPTPWVSNMGALIEANIPLIEKMTETSKATGTSVREALRKVGRNIEPMNNMAFRSALVDKTMRIMHNTIRTARRIMTKIQETRQHAIKDSGLAPARKLWGDKHPGSSEKQRVAYGKLAIVATINKLSQATDEIVRASPRLLVRDANGMYSINQTVFDELLKKGTFSKADFENGIEQFIVTGDGQLTSTGTAKLSQEDIDAGYDIYVLETKHMAESHLTLLENTLTMLNQRNETTVAKIIQDNKFKEADQAFADELLKRMYKLYSDIAFHGHVGSSRKYRAKQKEMAKQVLAELMRTMHNKEKIADWTDSSRTRANAKKSPRSNDAFKWREQTTPADEVKPFANQVNWFLQNDPATGKNRLERMHEIYNSAASQRQYKMLGAFQSALNSEVQAAELENEVIQSVLGNYVEFTREGDWRVFLEVHDMNGNKLDVNPELYAMLPVSYAKSQREALALQKEWGDKFKGTFKLNDEDGNPIDAKFDVGYGRAPGTQTLSDAPNVKEFLKVADVVGLKLDATQMKQISNLIENASGRKRLGLQRAGTPGMDANILRNNSSTLTRRAWASAKTSQAWMLNDVFADKKNTEGDWDLLKRLQREFDMANRGAPEGTPAPTGFVRNEDAVYLTETALLRYARQLRHMSKHTLSRPTVNIRTTKGEQKLKIEPEGEAHLTHATALKESLERNELEVNLNDLLSKTGPLRMFAVVSQLGSIAAGIMNAFTVITHLPWVLTARHEKSGYGEGFSFTDVVAELMSAVTQVGRRLTMSDPVLVKQMLDDAKAGKNTTSMTIEELEFMYNETLDGLLMPQQTYSMTGGTESNITNLILRNLAEGLMLPFSNIEAANRRISALATYRLSKNRLIRAGKSVDNFADRGSPEYQLISDAVDRVVYNSQGDYSNVNSPRAFRGDLSKFVMMYKMFPLMTQNMLYNLPLQQQLSVLAVLLLLGGLKGEPFADDFADIYDTLLQKLGFRHDSVELELIQTFEKIMPGSSNWMMHGFIDNLAFGGTMSSRVSMGDIIPLTGLLREGADYGREVANAFGPAYSANVAVLDWAWTLADFGMQSAGLKPQVTSWQELVRKIPQAQVRAIGEAAMMAGTEQITDPQGRLTSDDVTMWNVMSRMLGFYPLEATKANNAVRLDRMHIGYMRAVRARFILAYAQAYRTHDEGRMNSIIQQVGDWNESVGDTGQHDMLIQNFRSAANRAGRAASQTAVERAAAGAPNYSMLEELAGILNADTQTDQEGGD